MRGLMSRLLSHAARTLLNRLCTFSVLLAAYFLTKAMPDSMVMPINYVSIIILLAFLALVTIGEQLDNRIKAGRLVDCLIQRGSRTSI